MIHRRCSSSLNIMHLVYSSDTNVDVAVSSPFFFLILFYLLVITKYGESSKTSDLCIMVRYFGSNLKKL